jgi:two-component system CheB/CheR fusion protein
VTSTTSFPIVGVGASAGGLEAITELCAHLSADSGIALLVAVHLDPKRPSLLTEILAKRTSLTVVEATEGLAITPNHVYVLPSNVSMIVRSGLLHLTPRSESLGPPMPIDDLLASIAADYGPSAIGVILSGTGTDGAIGMQEIKARGGITLAQDDTTARFPGMPRAARGLGCVDLTLTPMGIASELLRIARHPNVLAHDPVPSAVEDDVFRQLFQRLRSACNIDFSHYKRGTLERRVARRQVLHDVSDLPAYLEVLDTDPAEANALCQDLLIRYTEFFRDPDAFAALADSVFPRLLAHTDGSTPLRIWVPGCSTGEEVYSIAICLLEYLARQSLNNPIQIFGTDISDEALDRARAARYIENIARTVSGERLHRFFARDGEYFTVSKAIRDCCIFARQNVAYDPPFSRLDLISCRNLMIYLDPVLQKRVLAAFHFALQRDGVLMLGPSETVGVHSDLFGPLEGARGRFFARKPAANRAVTSLSLPAAPALDSLPAAPGRAGVVPRKADTPESAGSDVDRIILARYAPATVVCDEEGNVREFRGDTGPFLANPQGAPTTQLQRLVRPPFVLALTDAMRQARAQATPVRKEGLRFDAGEASLEVVPFRPEGSAAHWMLVSFRIDAAAAPRGGADSTSIADLLKSGLRAWVGRTRGVIDEAKEKELERLGDEVKAAREQIRLMIEEHENTIEAMKALEEETLSSNEEFQSTNEELETAKEELQSVNEELSTTNDELRFRNRELKEAYSEANQARDYADAIIETIAQPLLILDSSLRVVRANQAFFETFHTEKRATLHAALFSLGSGQWNIPALRQLLEEILPRRRVVTDHMLEATFPNLGVRSLRLNAARVALADNELILLSFEDTTERQRVLTRLAAADRQKDEFLAMLAHELRNPLAVISNAVRLWKAAAGGPEGIGKATAVIERQLKHQMRMIDDLLEVSRITRGVVSLRRERFDLAQTVREVCEAKQEDIKTQKHQVSLVLPQTLVIDGDAARIEQVVTNLVANAIKYTPAGGRVEVNLQREDDEAVLAIADSGIGMSEQFLTEIFNVFAQADRSMNRNFGGLGIGLALARRLVELHGGSVNAFSAGLGSGSRFVVRLPIGQERRSDARRARTPEARDRSPSPPRRVLVVDDNHDAGETTAALLRLSGHQVLVVRDGVTALESATDFKPEALLLDIGMPGMDGYELCRRLRERPEQSDALIIAVSGYGRHADIEAAREAGFDHHVIKPFDPAEIDGYLRDDAYTGKPG